jgi:hypothetical protein
MSTTLGVHVRIRRIIPLNIFDRYIVSISRSSTTISSGTIDSHCSVVKVAWIDFGNVLVNGLQNMLVGVKIWARHHAIWTHIGISI